MPGKPIIAISAHRNCRQAAASSMIKFGVIGYGYWGPERSTQPCIILKVPQRSWCATRAPMPPPGCRKNLSPRDQSLWRTRRRFSRAPRSTAVAVVTPVWTHYELAQGGAPMAASTSSWKSRLRAPPAQGERIDQPSRRKKNLKIMVESHLPVHWGGAQDPPTC